MEIVIVTNGEIKNRDFLKQSLDKGDFIICADGAAKYLIEINIVPSLLVGDFDSIDPQHMEWMKSKNVLMERFPSRKDMTDTELAIEFALKKSPEIITIIGAIGSRIDHSLANIMLLNKLLKEGIKARIVNENNEVFITDSTLVVEGKAGQFLSIIPISGRAEGVTLIGLDYPLNDHTIEMGSSLGISNVFVESKAKVSVKNGILLVIKSIE